MIKKLQKYVYGVHFIVETDVKLIIGMLNKPDLPSDVASHWVAFLKMFDFNIRHIKGKDNEVTDALSRMDFNVKISENSDDDTDEELWVNRLTIACDDNKLFGITIVNQTSINNNDKSNPIFHLMYYLCFDKYHEQATEIDRKRVRAQIPKFFMVRNLLFKQDNVWLYNKYYYDQKWRICNVPLKIGDMVLLHTMQIHSRKLNKLMPKWTGPYKIFDIPNSGVYLLAELDGSVFNSTISGHCLKRYFEPESSESFSRQDVS